MPRKTFVKKIVTEELVEKINSENKKLSNLFLKEKSTRCSNLTIKSYRSDSNIFFVWNLQFNNNKSFVDIKKLEFSDFFSFTTNELQYGSARNNRLRSFLSSFSIFIEKFMDEEYPSFRNIVLKTIESVPKEMRREKTILSTEQVESLLIWCANKNSQMACWLALAVYSGSRFSELLRFTTDILDENHTAFGDLFMETTRQIKTKGRGKSGKLLYKYILKDKFLPYYKQWITDREVFLKEKGLSHLFLFVKEDGTSATEGTIRSWVATMENFLQVNVYPHALRHYLVTEFSRKNIPPMLIKDLVGWTSLEMVSLYDDTTSKDKVWTELDNLK